MVNSGATFDATAFDDETQASQDAGNLRRRNLHAENALYLAGSERNARLRKRARHNVDPLRDGPTSRGDDQLRNAGASHWRDAGVGSAFKTVRRIGMHAKAAGGAANRRRIEPGRLDEHVAGGVRDHRRLAAHDSSQRHRFHGVGDHKVFWRERALHAVESDQRLPVTGTAHDDLAALEFVEIEGVRGLADFVEHVVGGIGHIADAALLDQFEPLRDVGRGRSNLDSAHHAGGITRAAFGVVDDDAEIRRAVLGDLRRNRLQIHIVDG